MARGAVRDNEYAARVTITRRSDGWDRQFLRETRVPREGVRQTASYIKETPFDTWTERGLNCLAVRLVDSGNDQINSGLMKRNDPPFRSISKIGVLSRGGAAVRISPDCSPLSAALASR